LTTKTDIYKLDTFIDPNLRDITWV